MAKVYMGAVAKAPPPSTKAKDDDEEGEDEKTDEERIIADMARDAGFYCDDTDKLVTFLKRIGVQFKGSDK